jgi:hypothetical protein
MLWGGLVLPKLADGSLYRMPGNPVMTPYRYSITRTYQFKDDMVMVSLLFGNPSAKAWMLGKEIADAERARQHADCGLMHSEDEDTRHFFRNESRNAWNERQSMQREEEGPKVG